MCYVCVCCVACVHNMCLVCVCVCRPISFLGDPMLVQLGVQFFFPVTMGTGHHCVLIPAEAVLWLFRHPN